jgi:Tfp pilus assembly protein PilF
MGNHINENFNDGMAAFVGQDYGTCIDKLSEVIAKDQTHKLAYVSRGAAYLRTGKHDRAVKDFDHAIDIDAGYARAYHLRGLAHEAQGDDHGALADFGKAIELSPEYGAAYHSRATLLTKMGDTDRAAEDIQMVTHLTNRNIEAFANENNIWRSHHMQVEAAMETELDR